MISHNTSRNNNGNNFKSKTNDIVTEVKNSKIALTKQQEQACLMDSQDSM
jgi:hypothetical protein